MDADRFDALTRSLSLRVRGSRRGALGGLLGGALALLGLGEAEAQRKRKKTPRWPRSCPKAKVERCVKPAQATFVRKTKPCRPKCEANPKGSACKACLRPHARTLAKAARACADRLCRGGLAPATAASAASTGVESAGFRAAALPSCQYNALKRCNNLVEAGYVACLVAEGRSLSPIGLGACLVGYFVGVAACNDDKGCPAGVCLPSNVCCPSGFHTPCGEVCCPPEQVCENGTCKCAAGKCTGPSGLCPCPAGQTCLSTGCCPSDRVTSFGTCNPCPPAQVCAAACCKPRTGTGEGEVCTRDGCCPEFMSASNCRRDDTNCSERICCAHLWSEGDRGLTCSYAGADPNGRDYCCGSGKSCCFTGCCPDGSRCCGDNQNCCPDGVACGSASCFAPAPDHV